MPDRVAKSRSKTSHPKTVQRRDLVYTMVRSALAMKRSCSFCESWKLKCEASSNDSSRYVECVRRGQSGCDVFGVSVQSLTRIVSQYDKLDSEMERAEAELQAAMAKKRLWAEKMARTISRGLDDIAELERLEAEEAAAAAANASSSAPLVPASESSLPASFDWSPDPDFLASLDFVGRTLGASQDSEGSWLVPMSCLLVRSLTI
ncbi:hypothetical protein P885DRAFT_48047 [Corynascus similis CBS 632.67]